MLRNVFLLSALVACGGDASMDEAADLNGNPLAGAHARLHVVWYGDAPSFLVEARRANEQVLFYIDSAFAQSYVATPTGADPSSMVMITIGGKPVTVHTQPGLKPSDGYNSIDGMKVIGAIGADILTGGTVILDPNAGAFEVRPLTASEHAVSWHALHLRVNSDGYLFTDIDVDGQSRSLWVDTGSAHSLLFGPKQAGDVPITTEDTWGNGIHMFQGKDTFAWQDGFTRTAPTFHCPVAAWPDLVSEVAGMDPNAIGLLGLSTLGTKRIVFQGHQGRLLVE